jgi:uncharacterized membrane protein
MYLLRMMMIRLSRKAYGAMWVCIALILAAGWLIAGVVAGGDRVFLSVMVVINVILVTAAANVVRSQSKPENTGAAAQDPAA